MGAKLREASSQSSFSTLTSVGAVERSNSPRSATPPNYGSNISDIKQFNKVVVGAIYKFESDLKKKSQYAKKLPKKFRDAVSGTFFVFTLESGSAAMVLWECCGGRVVHVYLTRRSA